jgi:hypothetical protein
LIVLVVAFSIKWRELGVRKLALRCYVPSQNGLVSGDPKEPPRLSTSWLHGVLVVPAAFSPSSPVAVEDNVTESSGARKTRRQADFQNSWQFSSWWASTSREHEKDPGDNRVRVRPGRRSHPLRICTSTGARAFGAIVHYNLPKPMKEEVKRNDQRRRRNCRNICLPSGLDNA